MTAVVQHQFRVALGARSYPITIGRGLISDPVWLSAQVPGNQALIVTNPVVGEHYLKPVLAAIESRQIQVDTLILPDGEQEKNLQTLAKIFDALADCGHHKTTTLIALGGGVIGDMTGFAAACYQRGVGFIQLPTTLLAQVDASVGGKTAVNHRVGKNLIGAFHQPLQVIADMDVLDTLPQREYRAGLAELVKHAIIGDMDLLIWLEAQAAALQERAPDPLAEALYRSVQVKAKIVAEDERETGVRALLNFGHTFAHAVEVTTGYQKWLHGEAVAFGMRCALNLSVRIGRLSAEDAARAGRLLDALGLPEWLSLDAVDVPALEAAMAMDKKVNQAGLPLILLDALGAACQTTNYSQEALRETLNWAVQKGEPKH